MSAKRAIAERRDAAPSDQTTWVFFETADDELAAFMVVRGVHRQGFGLGEATDIAPLITHAFDDEAPKLTGAVLAYQSGQADEVPAGLFIQTLDRLRRLREDETLRRHRQVVNDLANARDDGDDL